MIATIISFVPVKIDIDKPGLIPREYHIPASDSEVPQVLHLEGAMHWVNVGEGIKKFPVRVPADELATAIVNDYIRATLAADLNEGALPAIFWAPDKLLPSDVLKKFPDRVKLELESQKRWLLALVKMADDDWQKLHRHSAISDLQRLAAKLLNIGEKDWILQERADMMNCPACKTLIMRGTIRCPTCTTILDAPAYKKFSEPLTATK